MKNLIFLCCHRLLSNFHLSWRWDNHWMPTWSQCSPCAFRPNVILHFENLAAEEALLRRQLIGGQRLVPTVRNQRKEKGVGAGLFMYDGMWYLFQGHLGLKAYSLCLVLFLQLNCFRWKTTSWLPSTFLCSAKKTLTGSSKSTGKTLKFLATHGPDQTVIKWEINWLNWNLWQQWFYDTQYTFDVNLRLT